MIRLFEMFAGYGGASFALKKTEIEHEIVGYSEINKTAIRCYDTNHPGVRNFGDCTKIDVGGLPDFDLLTGGFPCQSFSVAGKRRGFEDTRGTLFHDIVRIVKEKRPRYMLLENVDGLVTHDGGKTMSIIVNSLRKIGYGVIWDVLNSKDHGIPQNRKRVWMVCKYGGWNFMEFMFPTKEKLKTSVKHLLDKDMERRSPRNKRLDEILRHPTGKDGLLYELVGDTPSGLSRQNDRIWSPNVCPCLTSSFQEVLFYDNGWGVFTLWGKERFRLMGFLHDEINITGISENNLSKLSGNGWDINLASRILRNMLTG